MEQEKSEWRTGFGLVLRLETFKLTALQEVNGLRMPHPTGNRKHSRFMTALSFRKTRWLALSLLLGWLLTACSEATLWSNQGDACVYESAKPPLRRVVNYSDNALCQRKRPPRTPPNPRVRMSPQMPES